MENEKQTNLAVGIKFTPALLVDLDGTVRRSKTGDFIKNFNDIELMPGIEKLLWIYHKMGWLIIGISNQGGVAHGHKLPMEIELELDTTLKLFKQNPFHIVKMCMHMEGGNIEPFNHRSLCRKPDIGMLALAEQDAYMGGYVIDWNNSLFVGDRPEDEECAKNARIKFEHIDSFLVSPKEFTIGSPLAAEVVDGRPPENLTEVVDILLPRFEGMEKTPEFAKGEDFFASFCHSQLSGGIGMKIRNEFDLWADNSVLHQYFKNNHDLEHPYSMSDLIIRHVYRKMVKA